MKLRTKLLKLARNTFTPYIAVFIIVLISVFSSLPSKSCEKQDTLKAQTQEIQTLEFESNTRCEKDQVKKEQEKFNMMSLNLVYYLMNKFIDTSVSQE